MSLRDAELGAARREKVQVGSPESAQFAGGGDKTNGAEGCESGAGGVKSGPGALRRAAAAARPSAA